MCLPTLLYVEAGILEVRYWNVLATTTVDTAYNVAYRLLGNRIDVLESAGLKTFKWVTSATMEKLLGRHYGAAIPGGRVPSLWGEKAALLFQAYGPLWDWSQEEIEAAVAKLEKPRVVRPNVGSGPVSRKRKSQRQLVPVERNGRIGGGVVGHALEPLPAPPEDLASGPVPGSSLEAATVALAPLSDIVAVPPDHTEPFALHGRAESTPGADPPASREPAPSTPGAEPPASQEQAPTTPGVEPPASQEPVPTTPAVGPPALPEPAGASSPSVVTGISELIEGVEVDGTGSEAEEWSSARVDSSEDEIKVDESLNDEGDESEEETMYEESGEPLIRAARASVPRKLRDGTHKLRDGETCRIGCRDDEYTRLNFIPRLRWRACIQTPAGKLFAAGWSRSAEPQARNNGVLNCQIDDCEHDTAFCGARFLVMQQLMDIRVKNGLPLPADGS